MQSKLEIKYLLEFSGICHKNKSLMLTSVEWPLQKSFIKAITARPICNVSPDNNSLVALLFAHIVWIILHSDSILYSKFILVLHFSFRIWCTIKNYTALVSNKKNIKNNKTRTTVACHWNSKPNFNSALMNTWKTISLISMYWSTWLNAQILICF